MDVTRAQTKLNAGYAKLAAKLGRPAEFFRPSSAADPLDPDNSLGTHNVRLDPHGDFTTKRVALHGKPIFFAAFDRTDVLVGDYFVQAGTTYFVAAAQDLTPTAVVQCNRVINAFRPSSSTTDGYFGSEGQGETLLTAWPASVLEGTKGERSVLNLPNDTRTPWFDVLLPWFSGVLIQTHDRLTDDLGNEYIVSSVELTDLGYRLTAGQARA